MLPTEIQEGYQRPDEESLKANIERTRAALEKLINSKISAAMPVRAAAKQVTN